MDLWPNDWEELGSCVPKDREAWFAEVRKTLKSTSIGTLVSTDISVDRHIDGVPIRPITLEKSEMLNHDDYPDPNVIIFDYLKRSAKSVGSK